MTLALSSLLVAAVVVNLAESVDVEPTRANEVLEASRAVAARLALTPESTDDTVAIHLFGGIERVLIVMRRARAGTEQGSTELRLAPGDPVETTLQLGMVRLFSGALRIEPKPVQDAPSSKAPWVVGLLSVGAVAMAVGVGFGVHAGSLASNPDGLIDDALETRVGQYDDARAVMWLSGGIGAGLLLAGAIVALAGP